MKNPFMLLLICLSTGPVFAHESSTTISGFECTIDTYDSAAESGNVGGFDGDAMFGAYQPLMEQLRTSRFSMRRKDFSNRPIHYFRDTEFLIELKMNSGRGSNRNISLTLVNTGKFGTYGTVFFVETPNTGNTMSDTLKVIRMLPLCARQR